MKDYLDGYLFPIKSIHLDEYKQIAEQVAAIWKEYGCTEYHEFYGDDSTIEGTVPFNERIELNEGEVLICGWMRFPSKEVRDSAHVQVQSDPKMLALVSPLMDPSNLIFDASRMVYGGFLPLV